MKKTVSLYKSTRIDEEIKDELIEGLGEMFKHEETVLKINKSTYISNWIFNNLLQICSKSYENTV